jgi:hypothetical protein
MPRAVCFSREKERGLLIETRVKWKEVVRGRKYLRDKRGNFEGENKNERLRESERTIKFEARKQEKR